MQGEAERLEII